MASCLLSALVAFIALTHFAECNKLARGWGDDINWVTLEKAREISVTENKPVMVRRGSLMMLRRFCSLSVEFDSVSKFHS